MFHLEVALRPKNSEKLSSCHVLKHEVKVLRVSQGHSAEFDYERVVQHGKYIVLGVYVIDLLQSHNFGLLEHFNSINFIGLFMPAKTHSTERACTDCLQEVDVVEVDFVISRTGGFHL